MKKSFAVIPLLLFLILSFSGCSALGEKNASLTIIYCAVAILSLLLLLGCIFLVRKNKLWLITLFSSVLVVNVGYTFLAMSTCLEMALWANRLAYLGSVFLPLAMLMIILDVTGTKHPKWLHSVLGALSIMVFLIAASPGILPIYYKEVSFAVVDGVSTLVKVYGPLHPLYLIFLVGYFAAMVTVIIRAQIRKTIVTTAHAVILAIAVFVNIGVWLIEQLSSIEFEMLSVSYIISELFLLGVHLVMHENEQLRELLRQENRPTQISRSPAPHTDFPKEKIECYLSGLDTLTNTERAVYTAYVNRATTQEVLATLNIKENTLKFHNRNLYGKLGVSSRKELLEIHKYLSAQNGE